jgi:hypothetical protein
MRDGLGALDGPVTRRAKLPDGGHAGRQARRRAPWLGVHARGPS